jgi:hypothetical protein
MFLCIIHTDRRLRAYELAPCALDSLNIEEDVRIWALTAKPGDYKRFERFILIRLPEAPKEVVAEDGQLSHYSRLVLNAENF